LRQKACSRYDIHRTSGTIRIRGGTEQAIDPRRTGREIEDPDHFGDVDVKGSPIEHLF
jgi:hypothetical protein